MMYYVYGLVFLCSLVHATSTFPNPTPDGESWAPCSFAVTKLSAEGNGSTYGSCLACDPTSLTCPPKCQPLIDALYQQCDKVYAPQDYYFDPAKQLNGYFNDNRDALRIQAARCGCSTASQLILHISFIITTVVLVFMS